MELKRIRLDAIEADPNNPRDDFGDLKALAATFKLNQQYPGEPYTPPIVVADGNVYRIADGERRWRAMREFSKIDECNAIVCTDFDEADSVALMLATDDKKGLSDVERSRGVQRMLVLGVDMRKVEAAGRLKHGQGKRIKAAVETVGDAAEQATIDQILKASELQDIGGDARDMEKVLTAAPGDWEWVYRSIKDEIEAENALSDFLHCLNEAGFEFEEAPSDGKMYKRIFRHPSDLAEWLQEHPDPKEREGMEFVYDERNRLVELHVEPKAVSAEEGEAEAAEGGEGAAPGDSGEAGESPSKVADMAIADLRDGMAARRAWYLKACKRGSAARKRIRATPHVDVWIESRLPRMALFANLVADEGMRSDELAQGGGISSGIAAACSYATVEPHMFDSRVRRVVQGGFDKDDREWLVGWVEWVEAFMFDGWRMADGEHTFYLLACEELGRRPYDDGGAIGDSDEAAALSMASHSVSLEIDEGDLGTYLGTPEVDMSELAGTDEKLDDAAIDARGLVFS